MIDAPVRTVSLNTEGQQTSQIFDTNKYAVNPDSQKFAYAIEKDKRQRIRASIYYEIFAFFIYGIFMVLPISTVGAEIMEPSIKTFLLAGGFAFCFGLGLFMVLFIPKSKIVTIISYNLYDYDGFREELNTHTEDSPITKENLSDIDIWAFHIGITNQLTIATKTTLIDRTIFTK